MMADTYLKNGNKDKYNPKKKEALKFNPEEVAAWTVLKNKQIAKIIADRKNGLRD